jgi:broad-specificity NMP kinase
MSPLVRKRFVERSRVEIAYTSLLRSLDNLQRGAIRRGWRSWKAYENVEEMAIAIVRMVQMWEHAQTMGTQAATVDSPEVVAEEIAIAIVVVIVSSWESAPEMRRVTRAHWQGRRWKQPRSASSEGTGAYY